MGLLRRIAFAPLYRLADWVDDNPVSAVGVAIALGALAVLFVSVSLGTGTETGTLALDMNTAGTLAQTAIERPAYLAAVVVGLALLLFYDG
jgi:hypothetical protein